MQNCTITNTIQNITEEQKCSQPWLVFLTTELKLAAEGYQQIHATLSLVYSLIKDKAAGNRHHSEDFNILAANQVGYQFNS